MSPKKFRSAQYGEQGKTQSAEMSFSELIDFLRKNAHDENRKWRRFKEIMFKSSYTSYAVMTTPNRPMGHRREADRAIYDFVVKNKFKKIVDFGTWGGGSVICAAQALTHLSPYDEINPDPYDNKSLADEAMASLDEGREWSLHKTKENPAHIKVYDKYWNGYLQNGDAHTVLLNIFAYDCYRNVQFTFQKMDMWDWIKNPEPFDLLHIDIHNDTDMILKVVNALKDQIDEGSVILFTGGALRHLGKGHRTNPDLLDEYGIDLSGSLVSLGDPSNYESLKKADLGISILTQKYPGLICVDRRPADGSF